MIPAQVDEFGREIEKPIDTWGPRRGVALALTQLAPYLDPEAIGSLVQFFVSSSLGDRKEEVRKEMLNAALKIVDLHGKVRTIRKILRKNISSRDNQCQQGGGAAGNLPKIFPLALPWDGWKRPHHGTALSKALNVFNFLTKMHCL